MNFFEAQEKARRSTQWLVVWFMLALVVVILATYCVFVVGWNFHSRNNEGVFYATEWSQLQWWNPEFCLWNAVVVGGLVLVGNLVKSSQLSGGGEVVARSLDGRAVDPSTIDLKERQLLNVIEEMAIASGVPIPEAWILDEEDGINAFAAGTDPSNAVIGVTRGLLDRLTRSELQGVIAHEFSHILNGDMKLNMRLIGWIFGLVMLSGLGSLMLRWVFYSGGSRSRNSKEKGGGVLVLLVIGAAVWVIGSIGVLAARFLQAAISRQREYLADASAVQFTRETDGISGALKKIGGFSMKGSLSSVSCSETRHLFFASSSMSSMMRTHPPIEKRIRALDYRWDGEMTKVAQIASSPGVIDSRMSGLAGGISAADLSKIDSSQRLDANVGEAIRANLREGKVTTFSKDEAKFLLLGLLSAQDDDFGKGPGKHLLSNGFGEEEIIAVLKWRDFFVGYPTKLKLAVVDLSLSWLRRMSQGEAVRFIETSKALINEDGQIDLFEFMLQRVIARHVEIGLGLRPVPKIRFQKLIQIEQEMAVVLGTFAHLAGGKDALSGANEEYRAHTGHDLPEASHDLEAVGEALEYLDASTPLLKQKIMRLCGLVVTHDGVVDEKELELLRATAEAIGVPFPPMVKAIR